MTHYYHFTNYENLESISTNGLIPQSGSRTRSIGDKRCAIFLSKGTANAILMFVSFMHHYESFAGEKGMHTIKHYQKIVKEFARKAKVEVLDQEDIEEWEATKQAIHWIEGIMSYESFEAYIGEGVYLSISANVNINDSNEEDCYTKETIPPNKIKVVILRNKETGEVIDCRENVLTYFMSITTSEELLKNVHNVITIKRVKELYEAKQQEIAYYNASNFAIEEIPIALYVANQKRKGK